MNSKIFRKIFIALVVVGVLIAGGMYSTRLLQYNKVHVETDNAQIEGDIVPIIPRTAGYVTD
ncbi:MAG: HlyD family secretion protein, partial [Bacteroidota bacterium]